MRPSPALFALAAGTCLSVCALSARGQVTATWLSAASGNWSDPTRWSTNPDFPNNGGTTYHAVIAATGAAYTVTLDQPITIVDFSLTSADATFTSSGAFNFHVTGNWLQNSGATLDFNNTGGTITVDGTTTIGSGTLRRFGTMTALGPLLYNSPVVCDIDDGDLTHGDGSANFTGAGNVRLSNGATITNAASCTFSMQSNAQFVFGSGAAAAIVNDGILIRDTATGTTGAVGVAFTNNGTLDVRTGTFQADTVTNISGNALTGGTYLVGGGSIDFTGATLTTNAANVQFGAGAGTFAQFDAVTTNAPTGVIKVLPGRSYTKPGALTNNGQVEVQGTATLVTSGSLTNDATLSVLSGGTLTANGTFSNGSAGTLDVAAGGSAVTSNADLTNLGTINVGAGSNLTVSPGFVLTNVSGTTITSGTFNVAGTLKAPNLSGIQSVGARILLDGPASQVVNSANADALAGVTTINTGGELGVLNARNFTTASDITLNGTGRLTVGAGSTFQVNGTITNLAGGTFSSGSLNVAGTLQFNAADVTTIDGDLSLNDPAAQIIDENNLDAFRNLTTVTSNGSLGITNGRSLAVTGSLTSAGSLTVGSTAAASTLTAPGGLLQTAGTTTLANGTVSAAGGYNLSAGTLQGNGTVAANLDCNGTISPGASPGLLTISGTWTELASAALNIEVGGYIRGAAGGYDAIDVSGALIFQGGSAGTLNISLINGFLPNLGDQFRIIHHDGPRNGTFAAVTGTAIPGGLFFEVRYDPDPTFNDIFLVVVPSPASAVVLGLGALGLRRRRR